jgi:hypothetical protein
MNQRHLKAMHIIQVRGLEALKTYPLTTAMDAVRAIEVGVKQERLIRGEPSDRTAVSVEEVIKREYQRWMKPVPTDNGTKNTEMMDDEQSRFRGAG